MVAGCGGRRSHTRALTGACRTEGEWILIPDGQLLRVEVHYEREREAPEPVEFIDRDEDEQGEPT